MLVKGALIGKPPVVELWYNGMFIVYYFSSNYKLVVSEHSLYYLG